MANLWFKFYGGEYLSDPKIERLSPLERSCWITLLCLASMNGSGIIEFLTVESLLNKSGIQFDPYHPEEWEKALSVLTKFQNLKMINFDEEGMIEIKNWQKRQEMALTNAERQARYRENKKNSNEKVTYDVTKVTLEENRIEENITNTSSKIIFDMFWKPYPKKVERKKAEEKWQKLSKENQDKIIADLEIRTKNHEPWLKENGRYVPNPTTYLNGERWEDEIIYPKQELPPIKI